MFHIFMWEVTAITGIVNNLYMVIDFHPDEAYPIVPFFWTNIPNISAVYAVITAGIFLVIERICIITVSPGTYIHLRIPLVILDIIAAFGTFAAGMTFFLVSGIKTENAYCWNLSCAFNSFGLAFTIIYRYILEVIYTLFGVVCLIALRRYNKHLGKNVRTNKVGEAVVRFTIYTNLFVESIPLLISFLCINAFNIPIQNYVGAITRVFAIINGAICAWKYTASIKKILNNQITSTAKVTALSSKGGTVKVTVLRG
uniref:G_PROTEIN_RECEP_F1_2 domain-containing protein n=1 Tax=Panagrellus redivivus TaxID=6233 RepID=A0A7E4ZYW1_PANRE